VSHEAEKMVTFAVRIVERDKDRKEGKMEEKKTQFPGAVFLNETSF
jgi:hypothetical protein